LPHDASPAARALLALEAVQNSPGISAQRLGDLLGVTERAARRYVAILREAQVPIESVSGPYGGYRLGRGLRLPPLMFTPVEALGLVMAILEGHRQAADPDEPVGTALAKIIRVLPQRVAGTLRGLREGSAGAEHEPWVDPRLTAGLIEHCTAARCVRLSYRIPGSGERVFEVEPWAVVLRHSRWYLLAHRIDGGAAGEGQVDGRDVAPEVLHGDGLSARPGMRTLRVDRISEVQPMAETFAPPQNLDALRVLEELLSQGWAHEVEVLVDAPAEDVARWIPRSLGRLEPCGADRARLLATTDDPDWYARQLAALPASFRVVASPELRAAVAALGARLAEAADAERRS
jgi:predicted DNA-binding transcriptional regulator YafY